jgi:transcriptional regulator with XRE-family HTH domain
MKNFGDLIRAELKKQNRTQKDLADEVGISVTSMTFIVTGKYFPTPTHLENICKALKVELILTFESKTDV